MQLTRRAAIALFTLLVLIWGVNWTVVKLIVFDVPPVWSSALRSLIACSTVLLVQRATRNFVIPRRQDISIILIIGLLNMTACPTFMAAGVQLIPVGRSVVLGYTMPLWVIPCAWLFLREALPPRRLLGIGIGLCGIFVLCNPLTMDWGNRDALLGHGYLLLSALSWAMAIICIRAHVWMSTPFQLLFWQTLLASVLLCALAFALEGPLSFSPTPSLLLLLAYCGIPATALAFWAMTVINASLPATTTSLSLLATPVVGILGSILFLGEDIDLPLAIAAGLILCGIALGVFASRP
ncbi:MAG: DMT family transporter [Desulfovibrio sp.]|nr:DMT family transporter [Desulfovibrio sp.]